MKWKLGACVLLALGQCVFAGTALQQAQETLKEQGFYFGEISGEKNADTTAAIRRYQIRNGLKVTGELNDETLRALNSNPAATVQTGTPAPRDRRPAEPPPEENLRNEVPTPPIASNLPPPRAINPPPRHESPGDVFGDTPYTTAPAERQRQIVSGVQTSLRRRGFYRGPSDGAFGPELVAALRAYQSRIGLVATGQLDVDTLASLGLIPAQRGARFSRRRYLPEEPVRGEWIH